MDTVFKDRTAITGIGWTAFSRTSGKSTHHLAVEACKNAIEDSGLRIKEIDGVVTFNVSDSVSPQWVAASLGLPELRYHLERWGGGTSAPAMVADAAMAVACGLADNVVVFRSMNGRSGRRPGGSGEHPAPRGEDQFLIPYGWTSFVHACAMFARRHILLYGTKPEHFGAVTVAARKHGALNERAQLRKPITMADYLNSRMVADPLRLLDICLETDGACAVVVTSAERARNLKHRPVYIMAASMGGGPNVSGFSPNTAGFLRTPSHGDTYAKYVAPHLFRMAGVTPKDVDVAELYDEMTFATILQLEDYGFCKKGEGGPFVEGGRIELGGELPVNTHGGFLSEGYIHGLNHVVEAVQQLRGEAGTRQVRDAEIALSTGVGVTVGGALLLRR